ncbi:PadR family transcriptional regulator [Bacillus sp. FDAARGOS_235]|uniref:PadR family transcriptional regulator n=1 Tax=Bacillus sp. FDAARGOS_235 TaxID=1839798 RepID=UPI00119D64A7|nr:PadR family transcriptional regulator [Bacillus sp. FDAARGOS_235]
MSFNLQNAKFLIAIPGGESVEIKGVQYVSIVSNQVVDSDFGKKYSSTFTYEELKNIKKLKDIGFTPYQAWDIHFRKGKNWKQI